MVPVVQLMEDCFTTYAVVRIDGQSVSALSPLSACAGQGFLEYAEKLPDWLRSECNGPFTVQFYGGAIEACILRALFRRETACKGFSCIPQEKELIPLEERLKAAQRVAKASALQQLSPQPMRLLQLGGIDQTQALLPQQNACRWKPCRGGWCLFPNTPDWSPGLHPASGSGTLFVAEAARLRPEQLTASGAALQTGDVVYCIDPAGGSAPRFAGFLPVAQSTALPRFVGSAASFAAFAAMWVEAFVTRPALARLQAAAKGQSHHPQQLRDAFEEAALRASLTSPVPAARIDLPGELELGSVFSLSDALRHIPASVPVELKVSPGDLLQGSGQRCLAAREGTLTLQVCTRGFSSPERVLAAHSLRIRRVERVQRITLTLPGAAPVPRQEFRVAASWTPQKAENLNQAVWSVEPAGLAQSLGGGRFRACRPGSGVIRLTIGQVQGTVPLTVKAEPTAIRLPAQIDLRMRQEMPVAFSLLPTGVTAQVQGRTLDPDIAVYDAARGVLLPRREGSTTLELSAASPVGGACIGRCTVVVGPEHEIITPDWPTALMALTGALALLSLGTALSLLSALFCLCCGGYQGVQAVRQRSSRPRWRQELSLGAAAGAASLLLLLVQLL